MAPKNILILSGSESEFDGTCPNPACQKKVDKADIRAELLWRPSTKGSIPTYECKSCGQKFQFQADHLAKGHIEDNSKNTTPQIP